MNIIILIALAALILWAVRAVINKSRKGGGCCGDHEETEKKVSVSDRNKAHYPFEVSLQIGGMTCANCARKVENALNTLPDTWAKVDIGTKTASVLTKKAPDPAQLRSAVAGAGYIVLEIQGK